MTWRLHLTNRAIYRLDMLNNQSPLLAIWTQPNRVAFYEQESGVSTGDLLLDIPEAMMRSSDEWRAFLADVIAPNGAFLPRITTPQATIYMTEDGRMRLYQVGSVGLYLDSDGQEITLDVSGIEDFVSLAFDGLMGVIAGLDQSGKLQLYQQNIRLGTFDLGLETQDQLRPAIVISRGGSAIFATDGRCLVLTDTGGQVQKQTGVHYFVGRMACSPDGRYLATSDIETGVVRVYNGHDLAPTHQRFAIDLLAEATQIQLLADLPPTTVAPGSLAINNQGILAFAMSGVVCVTALEQMDELPRPQPLL